MAQAQLPATQQNRGGRLATRRQHPLRRLQHGSPGRHATRHAHHTAHPVIASYEPGERWAWCYVDQTEVDVPAQAVPYLR
jgi:hypothetical protein